MPPHGRNSLFRVLAGVRRARFLGTSHQLAQLPVQVIDPKRELLVPLRQLRDAVQAGRGQHLESRAIGFDIADAIPELKGLLYESID